MSSGQHDEIADYLEISGFMEVAGFRIYSSPPAFADGNERKYFYKVLLLLFTATE